MKFMKMVMNMRVIDSTLSGRIDEFENIMCFSRAISIKELIEDLNKIDFFTIGFSNDIGNYDGGLFWHSFETTKNLVKLTKGLNIKWASQDTPYVLGMFYNLNHCLNLKECIDLLSKYLDLTMEEQRCLNSDLDCSNLVYVKLADIMTKCINKL